MERLQNENFYLSHDIEPYRRSGWDARTENHGPKFYQRWLAGLGVLLVTWGSRLQNRYDTLVVASNPGGISESKANPC